MSRARLLLLWSLVMVSGACNSDVPEPATTTFQEAGLRVTLTRVATHPFLARYNLRLQVERRDGCVASSEIFPDTGQAGRRNVYVTQAGALLVVGQFDARVLRSDRCVIELVEFHQVDRRRIYLGVFDSDRGKGWRFFPPGARPEQAFERS